MTIFEALREDHQKQRTLVDLLIETEGDSEGRHELLERLKKELHNHAAAEERAFYIPLMERDQTQEKARHSVSEHHEMHELIEKLETTDFSSSGWLPSARKLNELVHHHLDEEEQEVFQMAGKVLSDEETSKLADEYRQQMESRD